MMQLQAEMEEYRGVAVLCLAGELDTSVKPDLERALGQAAAAHDRLMVDLGGVPFIDSSALGLLIGLEYRLSSRQGILAIVSLQPQVRRIFEVAGLFRVLRVFDDRDAAVPCLTPARKSDAS